MPEERTHTKQQYRLSLRFGDELLESGFTALPNVLLRYQSLLKITPEEMNFIIQIWYHWWDNLDPYPALRSVADRMGKHYDSVRSYSRSLQRKGFLVVRDRQSKGRGQLTSEYDFSPLIDTLKELWRQERPERIGKEVDWETIPRDRINTPRENSHRGGHEDSHRGGVSRFTPNNTKGNKTHSEEDPNQDSNSFELQSQIFNPGLRSKFSKIERGNETNSRRQGSAPTAIGQILRVSYPDGATTATRTAQKRSRAAKPKDDADEQIHPLLKRPRGRPKKYTLSPYLDQLTRDLSAEFRDEDHTESNLSFIGRVQAESGLSDAVLGQLIQEARQASKQRGDIQKAASGEAGQYGFKNRWPYFASTLVDLLGKEGKPVRKSRNQTATQS